MTSFHKKQMEILTSHSDEKEVLLNEIINYINKYKVKSLLDIGPGDGSISIPLSKKVEDYIGVESNKKYSEFLKNKGLNIITEVFSKNININKSFDMILFSHIIFDYPDLYPEMLKKAYSLLNKNGIILAITNDSTSPNDPWQNLRKKVDVERANFSEERFRKFKNIIEDLGPVDERTIETHMITKDKETMVQILAFLHSHGWEELYDEWFNNRKISEIIESDYQKGDKYIFPFQHLFILVRNESK